MNGLRGLVVAGLGLGLFLFGLAAYLPGPDPDGAVGAAAPPTVPAPSRADGWIAQLGAQIMVLERRRETRPARQAGLDSYRLLGLVELDGESWAMVPGPAGIRSLQSGDTLDGYEVVQIRTDRIVFARDGEDATLWLEP